MLTYLLIGIGVSLGSVMMINLYIAEEGIKAFKSYMRDPLYWIAGLSSIVFWPIQVVAWIVSIIRLLEGES